MLASRHTCIAVRLGWRPACGAAHLLIRKMASWARTKVILNRQHFSGFKKLLHSRLQVLLEITVCKRKSRFPHLLLCQVFRLAAAFRKLPLSQKVRTSATGSEIPSCGISRPGPRGTGALLIVLQMTASPEQAFASQKVAPSLTFSDISAGRFPPCHQPGCCNLLKNVVNVG